MPKLDGESSACTAWGFKVLRKSDNLCTATNGFLIPSLRFSMLLLVRMFEALSVFNLISAVKIMPCE